ncbi:MAG: anaerobic glycerol-3-phosphate dehydrogenase subunit A [Bacteroidales bacterium]|nr:anaerobic glycerol-3-phosphate dehydrogenase subunit A [Bacteroidales bacterium]
MAQARTDNEFDVIIVGGGITGAGTARDCAIRGLKVLLIERHDLATGATGRNHGLLHSGARYAVTDRESAEECIKENMILRKIARHCVEETEGLFITLPEDDLAYQDKFVSSCLAAGINAEVIDPKEALRMEPSANPDLIGAVKVPDGAVDPFRLTSANVIDAKLHGAKVLVYSEVTRLIKEGDTVKGVEVYNAATKQKAEYYAPVTVNAGGIWGQRIAEMAGARINMFPAKGALLIFGHRVNNVVLNRCRKPANADILVPGDTICLIGTTSSRVPFEEVDDMYVTADEVDVLLQEGEKLAPSLASTRILRAYAGVRPLVATDDDPSGRNISRGIVLLDHQTRDGINGFISITGGKLMTYRLMAEWATDLVCKKLGIRKPCITMCTPLPGSENDNIEEISRKTWTKPGNAHKATLGRHGARALGIGLNDEYDASLVCECEEVSVGEVKYAVKELDVHNLVDLRRRTRVGMGTCQGELCACRAAGLLADSHECTERTKNDLKNFVNERWKGMYPVCWSDTLRESEYSQWIYSGVCGLEGPEPCKGDNR